MLCCMVGVSVTTCGVHGGQEAESGFVPLYQPMMVGKGGCWDRCMQLGVACSLLGDAHLNVCCHSCGRSSVCVAVTHLLETNRFLPTS